MFIPDLDFFPSSIPDSGVKKAPDRGFGSATLLLSLGYVVWSTIYRNKELNYFLPKKLLTLDVYHGSGFFFYPRFRIQGSKKRRIRNTALEI
jgi:hypothetical protein